VCLLYVQLVRDTHTTFCACCVCVIDVDLNKQRVAFDVYCKHMKEIFKWDVHLFNEAQIEELLSQYKEHISDPYDGLPTASTGELLHRILSLPQDKLQPETRTGLVFLLVRALLLFISFKHSIHEHIDDFRAGIWLLELRPSRASTYIGPSGETKFEELVSASQNLVSHIRDYIQLLYNLFEQEGPEQLKFPIGITDTLITERLLRFVNAVAAVSKEKAIQEQQVSAAALSQLAEVLHSDNSISDYIFDNEGWTRSIFYQLDRSFRLLLQRIKILNRDLWLQQKIDVELTADVERMRLEKP